MLDALERPPSAGPKTEARTNSTPGSAAFVAFDWVRSAQRQPSIKQQEGCFHVAISLSEIAAEQFNEEVEASSPKIDSDFAAWAAAAAGSSKDHLQLGSIVWPQAGASISSECFGALHGFGQ